MIQMHMLIIVVIFKQTQRPGLKSITPVKSNIFAYFIPLILKAPVNNDVSSTLVTSWGQFLTLLCFMILIKPIREKFPLIMLQFNSMDRPEDRPNTLKWIVAYNIIPGTLLILYFQHLFQSLAVTHLVFIFIFVTGIGDGLAEPIGVYFSSIGQVHQYKVRSCTSSKKYVRSYEGSLCVLMSAHIFTALEYAYFKTSQSFWLCFWIMGPAMALAEATSPHTMDTPFLMSLGGIIIYVCVKYF